MKKQGPNQLLLFQHKTLFQSEKIIEETIKNYNNVTIIYYINESYFLYDETDLIKEIFITALNKSVNLWLNQLL